jgi:hypothetical protein
MKKLKVFLSLCLIAAVTGTGIIVFAQEEAKKGAPPEACKWDKCGKKDCGRDFKQCKGFGTCPMRQKPQMQPGCPMGKEGPDGMPCQGKPRGRKEFGRGPGMDPMFMLEIENPAKAEELKKLKESNPQEFGKALKDAEKEMFEKIKAKMDEFKKLVREYQKNKSDELKSKIRAALLEQYEVNIKIKEKMIQKMEEGLKKAKEDFEQTKSLKEKLVDIKLELLSLPPDLKDWVAKGCKGPKGPKGPECRGPQGPPKGPKGPECRGPQGPPMGGKGLENPPPPPEK